MYLMMKHFLDTFDRSRLTREKQHYHFPQKLDFERLQGDLSRSSYPTQSISMSSVLNWRTLQ
jgi:hypothetical protein